jgi:hypothetical protein
MKPKKQQQQIWLYILKRYSRLTLRNMAKATTIVFSPVIFFRFLQQNSHMPHTSCIFNQLHSLIHTFVNCPTEPSSCKISTSKPASSINCILNIIVLGFTNIKKINLKSITKHFHKSTNQRKIMNKAKKIQKKKSLTKPWRGFYWKRRRLNSEVQRQRLQLRRQRTWERLQRSWNKWFRLQHLRRLRS